jgi:hypothetical protein
MTEFALIHARPEYQSQNYHYLDRQGTPVDLLRTMKNGDRNRGVATMTTMTTSMRAAIQLMN